MSTTEESVKQEIAAALDGLPPESQQRIVRRMLASEATKLSELESRRDGLKSKLDAYEGLLQWIEDDGPLVLEKNDCSRLHLLKQSGLDGRFHLYIEGTEQPYNIGQAVQTLRHTFVVKHNWAAAFDGAQDFDGDVKLPYEMCAFELRISGKSFIAIAVDDKNHLFSKEPIMVVAESCGRWFFADFGDDVMAFIWSQIRAVCIALDAEVAVSDVVRAPFKLNEKRKKQGKVPLAEYRVIDLARRHRVASRAGSGDGTKKRLHFRRGHWRHYETHKTWIRWCLVGDPDLGFVGKHYQL